MPLQQGEVALLTLFVDVHTYLAPPTARPVHHRFDRRSYLYLFHDVLNKRGRIEIANNAGTPDQDAFNGYLDMSRVDYSYKQPTLFTVTVSTYPHGTPQNDLSQWHLPSFDPRNENRYMYKIHTLDLYLWTPDDASLFLDSLRRVLQPGQLVLSNVPPSAAHSEHRNSMSPVVQQLEQAAISGHSQRTASVSTTQSFPPPPPQPVPVNSTPVHQAQSSAVTPQNFAPMGYNPAAPAAPEHRVHREKTPPPPDAEGGTGLAAAHHDHAAQPQQFAAPPQGGFAPQSTPYMPGPPTMGPQQGMHRTSTMGSIPPQSATPYQTSFAGPPQAASPPGDPNTHLYAQQPVQQYASYSSTSGPGGPASPGFAPQVQSPGYGPPPSHPYTSGQPQTEQNAYNPTGVHHSMHSQVYVPEGSNKPAQAGPGAGGGNSKMDPSKLDQKFDRIEKGMGKLLKRLDKKL